MRKYMRERKGKQKGTTSQGSACVSRLTEQEGGVGGGEEKVVYGYF